MDFEKPNHRPNRKNKTPMAHLRKVSQASKSSTLQIHSRGQSTQVLTAAGETYTAGVEYSLNKGRRWELSETDFQSTEDSIVFVRATHPRNSRLSYGSSPAYVFRHQMSNDVPETEVHDVPKKTTKKDRKHFKPSKQAAAKSQPNSFSSDVYKAGKADALVEIFDQPQLSAIKTPTVWRDDRDHEARVHKTASITQHSM